MFGNTNKELEEAFNEQPTVSNPVEAVVGGIDDYNFFDTGISYSHADFQGEALNQNCIYLDVEYDQWGGHQNGYSKEEMTIAISKADAIVIARKFNLTKLDLSC